MDKHHEKVKSFQQLFYTQLRLLQGMLHGRTALFKVAQKHNCFNSVGVHYLKNVFEVTVIQKIHGMCFIRVKNSRQC